MDVYRTKPVIREGIEIKNLYYSLSLVATVTYDPKEEVPQYQWDIQSIDINITSLSDEEDNQIEITPEHIKLAIEWVNNSDVQEDLYDNVII